MANMTPPVSELSRQPVRMNLLSLFGFGVAYAAAVFLGVILVTQPEGYSVIWPASGVALAWLLLRPRREWYVIVPFIFVTNTIANLVLGVSVPVSISFALANTLEPGLAAWVLMRFLGPDISFYTLREISGLTLVCLFVIGGVAFLGAWIPVTTYGSAKFMDVWLTWWLLDGFSALLLASLIVTWLPGRVPANRFRQASHLETGLWLVILSITSLFIFSYKGINLYIEHHPYILFPILLWAAFRFSPRATSATIFIMAAIALACTLLGIGSVPLGGHTTREQMLAVQGFFAVAGTTALMLSAAITERINSEQALRASESRYRAIFDSSPIAIWEEDFSEIKKHFDQLKDSGVTDFRTYFDAHLDEVNQLADMVKVIRINRASTKLSAGETRDDAPRNLPLYFTPESLKLFKEELITLASGGTYFEGETPLFNNRGERFVVTLYLSVMPGHEHDLAGVLVSFVDVTETRQAANALLESQTRLNKAQEIAHIGHWEMDLRTQEITASEEAFRIYGLADPDTVMKFNMILGQVLPDDQPLVMAGFQNLFNGGSPYNLDFRIHRFSDGEIRYLNSHALLTKDSSGRGLRLSGTVQDITERKKVEETLRHYLLELQVLYDNSLAIGLLQEPHEIGQRIIQTLAKNLSWHHVAIRLRRGESDDLELIAFNQPGMGDEDRPSVQERFTRTINKIGQGLSGWSAKAGHSLLVSNVNEHPQYRETFPGICSGLYVPIKVGERVIGCISVESEEYNAFTEDDERLLATLASQDAVAFENSRLYSNARDELDERKRAEDALRESQSRLDLALRSNKMGVWHWDIVRNERYLDDQVCELLGLNPETYTGSSEAFLAAIHPDDRPVLQEALVRTISQDVPYEPEYRSIWADGSIHYIATRGKLVRDQAGQPVKIHGVNWDVTERKVVERALKTAEADYRALFENAPIGIYQTTPGGIFIKANMAMALIFGYENPEEMVNLVHSIGTQVYADPGSRDEFVYLVDVDGEVLNYENRCMRKDGSLIWISEDARIVRDEHGQPLYYEGFVQDITDRKLAEYELLESEERLQAVMDGSQLGYMDFDIQSGDVQRNARWAEMLGYASDEILPTDEQWQLLIHPEDRDMALQSRATHLAGNTPIHRIEYRMKTREGDYKWVLEQSRVVERSTDGSPLRMSGTMTDITELKLAEERVTQALHEKEVLLKELYHRTKNNMQVIISMMSLESMRYENPELQQVLQEMNNRILSMSLVHQMLYRSQNLSSIDLGVYIADLSRLVMDNYQTGTANIELDIDTESVMVLIDTAVPCGLIINEILSNALKYAFPQCRPGKISIRLSTQESGYVLLHIFDNGIGAPAGFDPHQGTTLGMQTIFGVASHQMRAKVHLDTAQGFSWRIEFADDRYRPRV